MDHLPEMSSGLLCVSAWKTLIIAAIGKTLSVGRT
jgi:hypothetical protein